MDIVFSFDTTGSMRPCIRQVRKNVRETCKLLFESIDDLRIGIIAHGDYCDGKRGVSILDLTNDSKAIDKFIRDAPDTSGGDSDEFYERILHEARKLDWYSDNRAFVMIGDAEPHRVGYKYNSIRYNVDWKDEAIALMEEGISIYSIHALPQYKSRFWGQLADLAGTPKLELNQFADINQLLCGLCFHQAGNLPAYEAIIGDSASTSVLQSFDLLSGRKKREKKKNKYGLTPVHPSRFQVLDVDDDCSIKDFVQDNGLIFKTGKGFYEFTKRVLVQSHKEIVLKDNDSGDLFTGEEAREILNIPIGENARVSPEPSKYTAFIQSTSANRKLLGGTKFLYEVE